MPDSPTSFTASRGNLESRKVLWIDPFSILHLVLETRSTDTTVESHMTIRRRYLQLHRYSHSDGPVGDLRQEKPSQQPLFEDASGPVPEMRTLSRPRQFAGASLSNTTFLRSLY